MRPWSRTTLRGALFGALLLAMAGSQARAAVPLGQLPATPPFGQAVSNIEEVQLSVASGNSYTMPGAGTITSWSTRANATAAQTWTLKVFRAVGGATYRVVGHSGPHALSPSAVNTFPANVQVQAGDLLGFHSALVNSGLIYPGEPADQRAFRFGNLADGQAGDFMPAGGDRLNIAAVFDPSNDFSVLRKKRNKRRGTAVLTVRVPNSGELALAGKGVKRVSAARARLAKTVTAPGKVKLKVRPKGKVRRKLNSSGKAAVRAKVTFTPTGGDPRTKSIRVKLRKLG
jgi:hypothetical protein